MPFCSIEVFTLGASPTNLAPTLLLNWMTPTCPCMSQVCGVGSAWVHYLKHLPRGVIKFHVGLFDTLCGLEGLSRYELVREGRPCLKCKALCSTWQPKCSTIWKCKSRTRDHFDSVSFMFSSIASCCPLVGPMWLHRGS